MIAPATIREIERLLIEGQLSHRIIAERAGVARSTVSAVAKGTRLPDDELDQTPEFDPEQAPERCPGCGAMVQMPCWLCKVRDLLADRKLLPPEPIVAAPLGLNLRPEHQVGYSEVRRWRREALRLGIVVRPNFQPEPVQDHPHAPP